MPSRFSAMSRVMFCSLIAGAMAFGVYGCAKKEAEQTKAAPESVPMEEVTTTPAAVGTYVAEVGADKAMRKLTVTLNADNTAAMMVEYMNGQPAMMQNGTWEMGATENDVNIMYGTEGAMMTMPFMMDGQNLKMTGETAMGFGAPEVNLVKQGAAATEDPHAGHNH